MEAIPVKEMKKWAKDTLPPMAWQRVTFRILPQLNKLNVFLHFFEDENYLLKGDVFKTLDNTFLEIFGKKFTDAPAEIIPPTATEVRAFVPTVVPVDEKKVVPTVAPIDDIIQESLKSFEKLAERVEKIISIEKNEEEISPKLEEKQPVKVDEPKVEKVEEILPIDEPKVEKIEEPIVMPEVVQEPDVVQEIPEIKPLEKIEEIELPKEEKTEPEKPKEKTFMSFFSLEQLKRIFGKK